MKRSITRSHWRRLLAAALLATLVSGLATASPGAKDAQQRANVEVVDAFIAAWDDPDGAVAYLAPDASVRMVEDQPAVVGRAAVADVFRSFMKPGVTLSVETLETTAYGPVVMNKRIDTMHTEGEPDQVFPVVGVFLVKDGKITEWVDYLDK